MVVGSANTDLVVPVPRLPAAGETVTGGRLQVTAGGKGANQAVAAARAGARVTLVAAIGRDAFGEATLKSLRREGIDTRHVVHSRTAPSGVALILVDGRGENLIGVARGSNDELRPGHIDAALPALRAARCLVVQLEIPLATVERAIRQAVRNAVPVLLNPAPARRLPARLLRQARFVTPNQVELAALTGLPTRRKSQVEIAARRLQALGVEHVLATCGARGVCWRSGAGTRWFAAPPVRAVDTVGAGDCFSGAFATAFAAGQSVRESILFGVAAAAIAVTRPGAQSGMPTRGEIVGALAGRGPRDLPAPDAGRHAD
jgi:ribokinase